MTKPPKPPKRSRNTVTETTSQRQSSRHQQSGEPVLGPLRALNSGVYRATRSRSVTGSPARPAPGPSGSPETLNFLPVIPQGEESNDESNNNIAAPITSRQPVSSPIRPESPNPEESAFGIPPHPSPGLDQPLERDSDDPGPTTPRVLDKGKGRVTSQPHRAPKRSRVMLSDPDTSASDSETRLNMHASFVGGADDVSPHLGWASHSFSPMASPNPRTRGSHDVLAQHQSKRHRHAPSTDKLAVVAAHLVPESISTMSGAAARPAAIRFHPPPTLSASVVTRDLPQPTSRSVRITTNTTTPWAPDPSSQTNAVDGGARTRPVQLAHFPPAGVPQLPGTVVAHRARAAAMPPNDTEAAAFNGRRRGSKVPAGHQLGSFTPNGRALLKHAREDYVFKIVTENAYPSLEDRFKKADQSIRAARGALPDMARGSSLTATTNDTLRCITDSGWSFRGRFKGNVSHIVRQAYGLYIPAEAAEVMAGGGNTQEAATYVRTRVEYLLDPMLRFLCGDLGRHTEVIYAHPAIKNVIHQWLYHPASMERRKSLHPMPYPVVAFVSTVLQCTLEEWSTGIRIIISFTEEQYRHKYDAHMRRLAQYSERHSRKMAKLMSSISDYCELQSRPPITLDPEQVEKDDIPFSLDPLDSDSDSLSGGGAPSNTS
ncbi:hypothetical protein PIIN_08925 [Serendipita indica DSM 11827]|uniref:DUF6532 domain-containing protein n=1 Tax=Serendipita indica (strain DSM 11827) TaxID=1109443 RepID=G4TUF2_SERID|nr:hypothetical protein PIIN_08925 [Serendipita indica DSM 11827]